MQGFEDKSYRTIAVLDQALAPGLLNIEDRDVEMLASESRAWSWCGCCQRSTRQAYRFCDWVMFRSRQRISHCPVLLKLSKSSARIVVF